MSLTPEDVEEIVRILDSTTYDELQLETDRFVLRLRRHPGGWAAEHEELRTPRRVDQPAGGGGTAGVAAVGGGRVPSEAAPPTGAGDDGRRKHDRPPREGLHGVRAPLPGVFYRAPKPGEAPFVEVGRRVEADTVVAILETMKLMNPVRAGVAGTVEEICVANNEPAEQGAVLMWVAPAEQPGAAEGPGEQG